MYFSKTMGVQCILVKQWGAMYFSKTMGVQCILVKQWVCNVF